MHADTVRYTSTQLPAEILENISNVPIREHTLCPWGKKDLESPACSVLLRVLHTTCLAQYTLAAAAHFAHPGWQRQKLVLQIFCMLNLSAYRKS